MILTKQVLPLPLNQITQQSFLKYILFEDQASGPSYWKFNSSLLEDDHYIDLIHSEYPNWINEFSDVTDTRVLWDLIKYRIRQVTIKYSKEIVEQNLRNVKKKLKVARKPATITHQKKMSQGLVKEN